jgi:hypothetical protein
MNKCTKVKEDHSSKSKSKYQSILQNQHSNMSTDKEILQNENEMNYDPSQSQRSNTSRSSTNSTNTSQSDNNSPQIPFSSIPSDDTNYQQKNKLKNKNEQSSKSLLKRNNTSELSLCEGHNGDQAETPTNIGEMSIDNLINTRISSAVDQISFITTELRKLQTFVKSFKNDLRHCNNTYYKRLSKKNKAKKPNVSVQKKFFLTGDMYDLCQLEKGSRVNKNEVMMILYSYIDKYTLRDEVNKNKINPNKAVLNILHNNIKSEAGDLLGNVTITYFNLQKYIKHHFTKSYIADE